MSKHPTNAHKHGIQFKTKELTYQNQFKNSQAITSTLSNPRDDQTNGRNRKQPPFFGKVGQKLQKQLTFISQPPDHSPQIYHNNYSRQKLQSKEKPTTAQTFSHYSSLEKNPQPTKNSLNIVDDRPNLKYLLTRKTQQSKTLKKTMVAQAITFDKPSHQRGDIKTEPLNFFREISSKRESTKQAEQRLKQRKQECSQQTRKIMNKDKGLSFRQDQNNNSSTTHIAEEVQTFSDQSIESDKKKIIQRNTQEELKEKLQQILLENQRLQQLIEDLRAPNKKNVLQQYYQKVINEKQQHISKLTTQNKQLNQQITKIRKQNDQLSQQNSRYKNLAHKQKVQQIQLNCYSGYNQAQKLHQRNSQLVHLISQSDNKFAAATQENYKLHGLLQKQKDDNKNLRAQLFQLKSESNKPAYQNSEFSKLKDQLNKSQQQKLSLEKQIKTYQQKIKSLEAKRDQESFQTLRKQKSSPLQFQIKSHTENQLKCQKLVEENQSLQNQIRQIHNRYYKTEQQIKQLDVGSQKIKLEKETEIQQLKSQLLSKEETVKKAHLDKCGLQMEIRQKEAEINQHLAHIKHLQLKITSYQSQKQDQNTIQLLQERQSRITNLQTDISNYRNQLTLQQLQVQRLALQLQKATNQKNSQINNQLIHKQRIIYDLQNNNKIIASKLDEALKHYNNLQKRSNEQSAELNKTASQLQLLKQQKCNQIASLQNQIATRDNKIESLKKAFFEEKKKLNKKIQRSALYDQQMQANIQNLQKYLTEARAENEQLQNRTKQLQTQNDQLNDHLSRLTNRRSTSLPSKQQTANVHQQNGNSNKRIKQLEQTLAIQKKSTASLLQRMQEMKRQFDSAQKDNKQTKKELAQALSIKNKLEQDLKQLNRKFIAFDRQQNKQKQINTPFLNQDIKQLQIKNQATLKDNETLLRKNSQLQTQVNLLEKQNSKYINISLELASAKSKNNQLEAKLRELSVLKQQNKQSSIEFSQLKSKLLQLQKTNSNLQANLNHLQKKSSQAEALFQQKSKLQKEFYRLKEFHIQLQQKHLKLCSQTEKRQKLSVPGQTTSFRHLFHGDILRDEEEHKLFIKQCIQKQQKIQISDTRLIYRYDPLSKQNIHKYIDEKPHLVVVLKLANGFFLAGYTEGVFKPRTISQKQGLIMSLTNRKCYHLIERNKRAISYDDFFIIFGNSEIRIKSQEKKVFSNFGVSNSYYRHNGDGVNVLLGGTKSDREMLVEGYEFFQLILKQ